MTNFDREDFDRANAERAATPKEERRNLTMIQQAGLSAKLLTGDPHWDKFLSYLQSALESNVSARDAFLIDIANPLLVNNDEVAKRRIAIMRLNERIEVLTFVISLPSQLIRLGDAANVKLQTIAEIYIEPNPKE